MSDWFAPLKKVKAKKQHKCIYCYGMIPKGEEYIRQSGSYDGALFTNKFHKECLEVLDYNEEFIPGEGEMPDRIKLLYEESE